MKALINGKILLKDGIWEDKGLLIDEKIRGICDKKDLYKENAEEIIDVKGCYISPGFIDIHIHGSGGSDTMDGTVEALKMISNTILVNGTTGFLPTTMTMDMPVIHKALEAVKKATTMEWSGAKILGVHMEGPFINKKFKGAQREDYIIKPNYEFIKDYVDIIKIITMAPEIEGSRAFIESVKKRSNAVLSIGHSNATYEEAMEAIEAGISHSTHLFNAMTPLQHRNPGVVGAVFNSNITCELIADKIHVHPELFKFILKVKGQDRLALITDAMRAGCMKEGMYELGGQPVLVKEGKAQLEDGSLAGSILTLNQAVKNFVEITKAPLYEVINLVSLNPARIIGIEGEKGSIEVGKDADIIVFDENIEMKMVFVEGCRRLGDK
ncbi:N-acetylglucosamine-6-phosphate deacetylase [Anaerovirgula multivorans]|uniref:N-acetylglucosamine-6-phosphate deacetylase n=1 Tax=Anaerovirgula multivorans TaxID=312168 RepID=A0A239FMJ3_9FIRM|nr:N-acetylglucosamine-6-phosphate deacetylase [Anaerovirgula multivorans]SNS58100.1 N-acetylglucosamine-6-phosphate deacetylase [Anaerovirgula multivorans]